MVDVGRGSVVGPLVGGDDFELPDDEHAASAVPAARAPRPLSTDRRLSRACSSSLGFDHPRRCSVHFCVGCRFVYYVCSDGAVAWCTHCNKFLTPPTVTPEGNCPRCGEPVERGLIPGMTRSADEPEPRVPWHLKLLGSALALYLGYRALQTHRLGVPPLTARDRAPGVRQ